MRAYSFPALALILVSCATPAATNSQSRDELIAELIELTGVRGQLEYSLQLSADARRRSGDQALDQLRVEFPIADALLRDVFEREFERMESTIGEAMSAERAMQKLTELYYDQFSDAELRALVAHWRSPLGRKDRKVGGHAIPAWTKWFVDELSVASEQAQGEFFRRLRIEAERLSSGRP